MEARVDTRAAAPHLDMPLNEPMRAEAPPRALAPLLGTQPTPRSAVAPSGPPAPAQRGPLAPAQPEALSGQPGLASPAACGTHRTAQGAAAIQQSIARIHEASQAPTLSPHDYRTLFDVMAQEIAPTASPARRRWSTSSSAPRASASRSAATTCASCSTSSARPIRGSTRASRRASSPRRFRNFVVARCRGQGLNLSADELDLIEAWFAAPVGQQRRGAAAPAQGGYAAARQPQQGMGASDPPIRAGPNAAARAGAPIAGGA